MPSLFALALLTLSFPSTLCYALTLPLEARDDRPLPTCQNKPYNYYPAGVMLPPLPGERRKRDSLPSDPAAQMILCTPGTRTYIKLTRKPPNGDFNIDKSDSEIQEQLTGLLSNTWSFIDREHLKNGNEDGVIDKGEGWVYSRKSTHGKYILLIKNAHHKILVPSVHFGKMRIVGNEVTWGVLQSALTALGIYMTEDINKWTECEFEIWDGRYQVGMAYIMKTEDAPAFPPG